jgi:anti-sigma factor RsiW
MKDTKFIELLNLYLDQHISPEDSALLEAEINRDPKRMQLYRQYCRMHKACSQMADSYRENAPARRPLVLEHRQRRGVTLYATGLIAAAACIALVLVTMPATDTGSPEMTVQLESSGPAVVSSDIPVAPVPVLPALSLRDRELQTVFSTRALAQLGENSASETLLTVGQGRLDWLTDLQATPLQFDLGAFEPINTDSQETRTFRSHRPFQGNVELTAFQFQR